VSNPLRWLMFVFFVLAVVGFCTGHLAVGFISAFMVVFTKYGERELDKRDAEFFATPAGAKQIADTAQLLVRQECECSASRF